MPVNNSTERLGTGGAGFIGSAFAGLMAGELWGCEVVDCGAPTRAGEPDDPKLPTTDY